MAHSHAQSGVNNHLHAHGKIKVNAKTDFDPTRTKTLRQSFTSALNKRWRTLRGKTRRQLRAIIANHSTQSDRDINAIVNSFRNWFTRTIRKVVLEPASPSAVRQGKHWTAKYVLQAAQSGFRRAREVTDETTPQMQRAGMNLLYRPPLSEQLKKAYVTAYQDLVNIVEATIKKVIEALKEALREQKTVKQTIKKANSRIDAVGQTRSELLANTRTVDTVNKIALIVYALLGYKLVGAVVETPISEGGGTVPAPDEEQTPESPGGAEPVEPEQSVEWTTANDEKVCPTCLMLEGRTWPLEDVLAGKTPIPPIHPNCRCLLVAV